MSTITNTAYAQMTKDASPKTNVLQTVPRAFVFGGGICVIGQAFINLYMYLGLAKDVAMPMASVTLIFLAALLTGLNVYDDIARYGGAGSLVPITGFANAITSPALEFKSEGYILGLGSKMFIIAGPVLVYGLVAGIIYGFILYLFQLY